MIKTAIKFITSAAGQYPITASGAAAANYNTFTPWGGKYNGAVLPAGVYCYLIGLKNGQPLLSGWAAIVR